MSAALPAGAPAAAIREAQVLAAMQFLSNPKVSSSPVSRKVKFLEEVKQLTPGEICEAFHRHAPNSPEHKALELGLQQGKTATEAVAGMDEPSTAATAAAAPSAGVAAPAPVAVAHAPAYSYAAPPGFVAGPPSYAGGPPTFYPVAPPPAAPASSWSSVVWTAAGVLGSVAAAGLVAKRAFGWELTQKDQSVNTTDIAANAAIAQQLSTALVPVASQPPASSVFGQSTAADTEEEEEESEEKYLGAWLGTDTSSSKSYGKSVGKAVTEAVLTAELHTLSEKLDQVVEALRDNQLELRKLSARSSGIESTLAGSGKVESLLSTSIQTQNEMLATLKIMLSAQARASKENAAAAAATAAASASFAEASPATSHKSWPEQNLSVDASPAASSPSSATSSVFAPSPAAPALGADPAFARPWPVDPLIEGARKLEDALHNLRAQNTVDEVKSSCVAMVLYIDNLLNNMTQPRYRKILLANSSYESRVRKTKGAEQFLLAAGFEINKPYIEWILPDPNSETPSLVSGSAADGTGSGLVMDEQQKTKHLQEALSQLKHFQNRLQSEQLYDVKPPTATSTPAPVEAAPAPAAAATVPFIPLAQPQMAPQTSFSAYATSSSQPPQQQPQPQFSPAQPAQLNANFVSGTSDANQVYDISSQPSSQILPAPQPQQQPSAYQQAWQAMQSPQQGPQASSAHTSPSQPSASSSSSSTLPVPHLPQQPYQPQSMMWPQQPQMGAPAPFQHSHAFSYPNTPLHPQPTAQYHTNPSTPLPPPQFQVSHQSPPHSMEAEQQPKVAFAQPIAPSNQDLFAAAAAVNNTTAAPELAAPHM